MRNSLSVRIFALATALVVAWACSACGGQGRTHRPAAPSRQTASASPQVDLSAAQASFAAAMTSLERDAVALRTQATDYQQLVGDDAPAARRARAVKAIAAAADRAQRDYWRVSPIVLAVPTLKALDLGSQQPSANLRPDESGQPLTQLAALLGAGTGGLPASAILSVSPTALAADTQLVLDRAGQLAVRARATRLTPAIVNAAVARGLEQIADDGRAWAQAPSTPLSDGTRDRATALGLRQLLAGLPAAVAARSLTPAMANLASLLRAPESTSAQRAILAPELAWRATDMATRAARTDFTPGPQAAAVEQVQEALFWAWWQVGLGDRASATREVGRALSGMNSPALAPLRASGAVAAIDGAAAAATAGDEGALAAARGRATADIMVGAYRLTLSSISAGDAAPARQWAAVRDFGEAATGGVGDDALTAADRLAAGTMTRAQATLSVRRDELDALQRRDIALVGQATLDQSLHLPAAGAQAAALADGYWTALAPIYAQRVGAGTANTAQTAFDQLSHPGAGALPASLAASQALGQFTAAPATPAEQEQRIRQLVRAVRFTLTRSCSLAPAATPAAQLPGTTSGPPLVKRLIDDLRPTLTPAQYARLSTAEAALTALPGSIGVSGEQLAPVTTLSAKVKRSCQTVSSGVQAVFGGAWQSSNDDDDFDRIDTALAGAKAAVARGDWPAAQGDARSAYAIFDVSTELGLRAVSPGLATQIEGLFWNGNHALLGQVGSHAAPAQLDTSFATLHETLLHARVALDSSHSTGAVVANSAIIMLREGLEALLVIAALGTGFVTSGPRWRRPVIAGALAAAPATLVTWLIASRAVQALASYGLALQAILDLVALAVVAVMLAWFFQKYCWTRFVAREHARRRRVLTSRLAKGTLRPMIGLSVLGFMVVYREGFETVLFLQAAKAQAGGGAVAAGVLLGTVVTAAIGVLMLILRRRLPYRQVVVVAAILVGIMAVALTGQAARSMQAAGWLAITPVPIALPAWMGLWLGLYASVQTLGAQLLAIIAIASGRVISERLRARRLARRLRTARAARPPRATTKRPVGAATAPDIDEVRASADAAPPRVPAGPRS